MSRTPNVGVHRELADRVIHLIRSDEAVHRDGRRYRARSFEELHDEVDANEYLNDAAADVGYDYDPASESDLAILNDAADIVSQWLEQRIGAGLGTLWVGITGNPVDGITLHGPFADQEDAIEWGDRDCGGEDWWIAPIQEAP